VQHIVSTAATAKKFDLDRDQFRSRFPNKSFVVKHNLVGHPLFELRKLIEASRELPPEKLEFYPGDIPVSGDPRQYKPTGLTIQETIDRIETAKSWLVLKNVNLIPEYYQLMNQCLDEIEAAGGDLSPKMRQREAWVFVTSPNSVTPYHFDPEHNFLLQVRGNKTVHIFDGNDRSIVKENDLENYYTDECVRFRNLVFKDEYMPKAQTYTVKPGEGVYIPYADPHWVKNEDNVSISFSISFYSHVTDYKGRIHRLNAAIRALGFQPTPINRSPGKDKFKHNVWLGLMAMKRLMGKKQVESRNY
jgi:hypothetical protein